MAKNRVIIIEDDQELGDLVRIYVTREGIEASLCGSAEAGLALFHSIGADLIVLDINLPGMDGFAFLQALRRESFVPVIIISARESDEDIVMGLGIGADEFVTKPFVPRVLVARISAMLRRGGSATPKRISFDSYVLDYEGYTLTRDGRRITLSTREFELLRHLVTHPGVAMTPDDIYRAGLGIDVRGPHGRCRLHPAPSPEDRRGSREPPVPADDSRPRLSIQSRCSEGVMTMRLGTKFALLIVGTIAVPVATTILIGLVAFTILPGPNQDFGRAADQAGAQRAQRKNGRSRADTPSRARRLPVLRRRWSTMIGTSSFRRRCDSDSLADILAKGEGRQVLTFDRYTMHAPDGTPYSVYVGVRMINAQQAFLQRFMGVVFLLSLLGFMTLMSALIIRSINASIARLEEGTRRISEGDLDFELNAKGNDRIASLTRSFDIMRKRVREETATRSRFIMAVSHDLKTPLSSITGYLDAIGDGIASDPVQLEKYLAIIRDKAGLLGSRIGQLIDYVKLDTADWRRSRERIAIASFLDEAVTVFRLEAEARGFGFDSSIDIGRDTRVFMDGDLVTRALENLVHNAFRYGEPPSPIAFHAAEDHGRITIRIVNQGKAIPAADLPFIFEPFFRGIPGARGRRIRSRAFRGEIGGVQPRLEHRGGIR